MVNMYELKLTNLQQRILRLLFIKSGTSLNQRRIAQHLNTSPPAVMKALPKLHKKNLITAHQDKESKRWAVTLNKDNHNISRLKRADNLKLIYESGLADFLDKEFAGATIILFGSYSRGEDTAQSDIDIAVIGRKEKHIRTTPYEKLLERTININFYTSLQKVHTHLKENLFNGIVISGGIEL
jgi:predicted nucleotidyltransferase